MMSRQDIILDNAFKAYNQGELERAEGLARDVLTSEPAQGDALYLLGLIAFQSGALEPAVELLFQAVKLYPKIENYTLMLASILHKQGRLEEALTYYQKFPKNPQSLVQQGFIYLQQRKNDIAKLFFEKAIKIKPDLAEVKLGLSLCTGDKELLKKVAQDSNLPDAWYHLARVYLFQNRLSDALQAIDKTGLNQVAYLLQKGIILESLNEKEEALMLYRMASQKDPYRSDVWTNQANIFRDKGEYQAAEDYYKRALAQDFEDIPSRHNLAELLHKMGRIAEALEQYRAVLIRNPDHPESLYNLAIILEERGEYAEATGLYFKVLLQKNHPKGIEWRISDTLSKLATVGKEELKLAIDFANGWVKNFPENVVAGHTLASLTNTEDKNVWNYTVALYDAFADSYDDKMQQLSSVAVQKIIELLPQKKYKDALDLGCGTGSFGKAFGKYIEQLTGLDLSAKMIAYSKKTNVYQNLIIDEAVHYLKKNSKKYDLIVAVEMMSYLPDIKSIIGQIADHLKVKGLCAFTIETTLEDKPKLGLHGRYLYPAQYVVDVLTKNKLVIKHQKLVQLRREGTGYADGLVILIGKVS